METRANYLLIGLFTLGGIIGAFAFLLWFASVEVDRQYSYYFVRFDNVAGLGNAGDVRYNGLPVGQVVDLQLDPDDPSKVRVQIEVGSDTPVKTDTVAVLQSQGVTGVSYVALSGGSAAAEDMPEDGVIQSEQSALQTVFEGAPELLNRAIDLLEDINDVVNEENKAAVSSILDNLASASGRLDGVLSDFEGLSADIGVAAREVAAFSQRLDALADTAGATFRSATETFDTATVTLESIDTTAQTLTEATQDQLPGLIADVRETAQTASRVIDSVGGDVTNLVSRADGLVDQGSTALESATNALGTANTTFETATGTLGDISGAMAAAETTLTTADQTLTTVNTAIVDDLDDIVDQVRTSTTAIASVMQGQVPDALGGIQTTMDTATRVIDTLGENAAAIVGRVEGLADQFGLAADAAAVAADAAADASNAARDTFNNSDQTLADISAAMASAETTLDTAGETFTTVNGLLDTDVQATLAAVRQAAEGLAAATADELPPLLADVRDAAQTANRVLDEVGSAIQGSTTQFDATMQDGTIAINAITETMADASVTFSAANETLSAVTEAMDAADVTLAAAETTFTSVTDVIQGDVAAMVSDLRETSNAVTKVVLDASNDIDVVADQVLAAANSAASFVGTLDDIVSENERQVSTFLRVGLGEFTRFIEESRFLVNNLNQLVRRIERDPARFLLGTQSSEFRR